MAKKYEYDIAFSVAEENLAVAVQIASALRERDIKYYLYTEHRAANFGKPLMQITREVYEGKARYVLIITSSIFVEKYWAGIENQVVHHYGRDKEAYMLQLRLDDTPVDGLSKHAVFEKWRDNPHEIAAVIAKKLLLGQPKQPLGKLSISNWLLAGVLFAGITVSVLWNDNEQYTSGTLSAALTDSVCPVLPSNADTVKRQADRKDTGNVIQPDVAPSAAIKGDTVNNSRGSMEDTFPDDDILLPVTADSVSQFDYRITVAGGAAVFGARVADSIKYYFKARQLQVTNDPHAAAKNNISLSFDITSNTDAENEEVYVVCAYEYKLLKSNGSEGISDKGTISRSGAEEEECLSKLAGIIVKIIVELYGYESGQE